MSIVPEINFDSPVAVYVQIKNTIMFAIASGKLKPGDRLVPVKDLGDKLGINFNTVSKAYRELEILGLIYTRRGLGCFVKDGAREKCEAHCRTEIVRRIHEAAREAVAAGVPKSEIKSIVNEVVKSNSAPYAPAPARLLAKAKSKKK